MLMLTNLPPLPNIIDNGQVTPGKFYNMTPKCDALILDGDGIDGEPETTIILSAVDPDDAQRYQIAAYTFTYN